MISNNRHLFIELEDFHQDTLNTLVQKNQEYESFNASKIIFFITPTNKISWNPSWSYFKNALLNCIIPQIGLLFDCKKAHADDLAT